jgi:hypothetical protein
MASQDDAHGARWWHGSKEDKKRVTGREVGAPGAFSQTVTRENCRRQREATQRGWGHGMMLVVQKMVQKMTMKYMGNDDIATFLPWP